MGSHDALRARTPIPIPPVPGHTCSHEDRLDDHSDRIKNVENRLHEGDLTLAGISGDIKHLTEKVGALISVITWVGSIIGGAVILAILATVLPGHMK